MKMSDVFEGDVIQDADTLLASGYGELADFSGYKKEARYVAHAINNHDRLEQESAELRKVLQQMVEQFECDHNCEYEYKLIKASKQLINK